MVGFSLQVFALGLGTFIGLTNANYCDTHGNWESWSACDQPCGGGFRTRQCDFDHASERERCNPTCYNGGLFFAGHCHCVPGTTGPCCTDIKECDSNPCKNGGSCEEHVNYYRCHCAVGTTQPNCDDIIQECLSNPCKNNGTCIELVNAYQCSCPAGTTGVHCDDIQECLSNPCLNGGTCVELINGYQCLCGPGTTGYNCVDVPECASHPCRNGGVCNEILNGVNCTCPRKYTGTYCEKDLFSRHDSTCHPGSCYFVFRVKDTWEGAKKFCEARQGHLVVPDNMAEQLFLETYLDSMRVRYGDAFFWMGGKKSGTSPAHWITGPYSTYERWPLGVSDNVAGNQCLALDADYDFMWQAFPCDRTAYFICEETTPFSLGPTVG